MVATLRTPAARLVAALGLSLSIVAPPLVLRSSDRRPIEVAALPGAVEHTVSWAAPSHGARGRAQPAQPATAVAPPPVTARVSATPAQNAGRPAPPLGSLVRVPPLALPAPPSARRTPAPSPSEPPAAAPPATPTPAPTLVAAENHGRARGHAKHEQASVAQVAAASEEDAGKNGKAKGHDQGADYGPPTTPPGHADDHGSGRVSKGQ